MAGVATAQIGAHARPRAAPETREIAGDLEWAVRRRQQMERQRRAPAGKRRVCAQAEQFLHTQRDSRAALGAIIDGNGGARGRDKMRRRFLIHPAAQSVGQQALQRDPKHLPALLLMSWALSTNPEFEVRQGRESLALAERALHAGKGRDPAILEALAAAYAELGRFPEACAATEEAIQTLTTARSPRLPDLQARLALYRNAQPYRENPSQPQS